MSEPEQKSDEEIAEKYAGELWQRQWPDDTPSESSLFIAILAAIKEAKAGQGEDRKRLDWLDAHGLEEPFANIRHAIDAAMKNETKEQA